jgi:hypothetical protein
MGFWTDSVPLESIRDSWCFQLSFGHMLEDGDGAFDEDNIDITRKFVDLRYQLLPCYIPCF